MSADNGIYVLETKGPEFRVAHLQAIDNLTWDDEKKDHNNDPDVAIKNARSMFGRAKKFKDKESAILYAHKQAEEIVEDGPLEYGVCSISIDRKF